MGEKSALRQLVVAFLVRSQLLQPQLCSLRSVCETSHTTHFHKYQGSKKVHCTDFRSNYLREQVTTVFKVSYLYPSWYRITSRNYVVNKIESSVLLLLGLLFWLALEMEHSMIGIFRIFIASDLGTMFFFSHNRWADFFLILS